MLLDGVNHSHSCWRHHFSALRHVFTFHFDVNLVIHFFAFWLAIPQKTVNFMSRKLSNKIKFNGNLTLSTLKRHFASRMWFTIAQRVANSFRSVAFCERFVASAQFECCLHCALFKIWFFRTIPFLSCSHTYYVVTFSMRSFLFWIDYWRDQWENEKKLCLC